MKITHTYTVTNTILNRILSQDILNVGRVVSFPSLLFFPFAIFIILKLNVFYIYFDQNKKWRNQ
jgi:hypothetical protein